MDIFGEIFLFFILLFLLGTLFRFALPTIVAIPLLVLEKLKKLGMPKWIFWILGSIVCLGWCSRLFICNSFVAEFFGLLNEKTLGIAILGFLILLTVITS